MDWWLTSTTAVRIFITQPQSSPINTCFLPLKPKRPEPTSWNISNCVVDFFFFWTWIGFGCCRLDSWLQMRHSRWQTRIGLSTVCGSQERRVASIGTHVHCISQWGQRVECKLVYVEFVKQNRYMTHISRFWMRANICSLRVLIGQTVTCCKRVDNCPVPADWRYYSHSHSLFSSGLLGCGFILYCNT